MQKSLSRPTVYSNSGILGRNLTICARIRVSIQVSDGEFFPDCIRTSWGDGYYPPPEAVCRLGRCSYCSRGVLCGLMLPSWRHRISLNLMAYPLSPREGYSHTLCFSKEKAHLSVSVRFFVSFPPTINARDSNYKHTWMSLVYFIH